MIIIITGATHAGKTLLAQKIMEKRHIPYVSEDHVKMGLIRSGYSSLTPDAPDSMMTEYLWPIFREMIKTAIENKQHLIVEGCYIPFNWRDDFDEKYLREIKYICLCFSNDYIKNHYSEIMKYGCCIESRVNEEYCTVELLIKENNRFRDGCKENGLSFIEIDNNYEQIEEMLK